MIRGNEDLGGDFLKLQILKTISLTDDNHPFPL